jgi:hypothetical protein
MPITVARIPLAPVGRSGLAPLAVALIHAACTPFAPDTGPSAEPPADGAGAADAGARPDSSGDATDNRDTSPEGDTASLDSAATDDGPVSWSAAVAENAATGTGAAVTFDGTSALLVYDQYPPMPLQVGAPELLYQAGTLSAGLGPPAEVTHPGAQPGLCSLASASTVLLVYNCTPTFDQLCWFLGGLAAPHLVSWAYSNGYGVGFHPRLASIGLPAGPTTQITAVIEVHMEAAVAGPLDYVTTFMVDSLVDAGWPSGPSWSAPATYDSNPGRNPAVAIASMTPAGSAPVVEIHEDPGSGSLYYDMGVLTAGGDASAAAPDVAWNGGGILPDGEQGASPAIAAFGRTVVEVHQSLSGPLVYTVGTIGSSDVTWGATHSYDADGVNPAIAIDPSTGSGFEAHESRSNPGRLVVRSFVVHP